MWWPGTQYSVPCSIRRHHDSGLGATQFTALENYPAPRSFADRRFGLLHSCSQSSARQLEGNECLCPTWAKASCREPCFTGLDTYRVGYVRQNVADFSNPLPMTVELRFLWTYDLAAGPTAIMRPIVTVSGGDIAGFSLTMLNEMILFGHNRWLHPNPGGRASRGFTHCRCSRRVSR